MKKTMRLAVILGLTLGAVLSSSAQSYSFRTIDVAGTPATGCYSNNNAGVIVGEHATTSVGFGTRHGYLLIDGTFTTVAYPGALVTDAIGLNNKNVVVGGYTDSSNKGHGFAFNGSKYASFDFPGAVKTSAEFINDSNAVVGAYSDASRNHGFRVQGGKFTSIDFPGAAGTDAFSVSNSNQIVGSYSLTDPFVLSDAHGFLLSGSTYTTIDYPGATSTDALGINNAGDIVGDYADSSGNYHGYRLSGGVYTTFDFPGAVNTIGNEINDSGQIVGTYNLGGTCCIDSHGFLATPSSGSDAAGSDRRPGTKEASTQKE